MPDKILIVDDSPSTRMLIKFSLQKQGDDVYEAENGELALDILNKNSGIKCLVTDINMPVMNGIDLIKNIRAMSEYRFLPVIALTNPDNPENRIKARNAGATAWIDKPFKPNSLVKVIKKLVRKQVQA